MHAVPRCFSMTLFLWCLLSQCVAAQDISLLPKHGSANRSDVQKLADDRFIAGVDQQYNGDRKKAAQELATSGWQSMRQGNPQNAMRRFNQSWLLNPSNGHALWGMGTVQGATGKFVDAMKLFQEAEKSLGDDIDFAVDYARTQGMVGVETKDKTTLQQAFERYAHIQERAPDHTLNFQNWAITLFSIKDYAGAWKKVQLAEATPRHSEMDPNFVAALQEKMPRPSSKP